MLVKTNKELFKILTRDDSKIKNNLGHFIIISRSQNAPRNVIKWKY